MPESDIFAKLGFNLDELKPTFDQLHADYDAALARPRPKTAAQRNSDLVKVQKALEKLQQAIDGLDPWVLTHVCIAIEGLLGTYMEGAVERHLGKKPETSPKSPRYSPEADMNCFLRKIRESLEWLERIQFGEYKLPKKGRWEHHKTRARNIVIDRLANLYDIQTGKEPTVSVNPNIDGNPLCGDFKDFLLAAAEIMEIETKGLDRQAKEILQRGWM